MPKTRSGDWRPSEERLALTAAQLGMWFAQEMEPDNPAFRAAEFVEIRGRIQPELLERALRQVVAETQMLRVRFETDGEQRVWQVVEPCSQWPLPVVDLRGEADPEAAAQRWMWADLRRTVDLRRCPSFSFAVLRTGTDRFLLYLAVHHIMMDGWSMGLFLGRLTQVYSALDARIPVPASDLEPLARAVSDNAEYHASPLLARDRDYWAGQLADWPRAAHSSQRWLMPARTFERVTGYVGPEAAVGLRALARSCRTNLAGAAMAALALYVQRLGRRQEAVLDVTVTGRGPATRRVPSMLANVLPLRVPLDGAETVADLMGATSGAAKGLVRHQRYPFWYLVRELGAGRRLEGCLDDWGINVMTYDPQLSFGPHPAVVHNLSNGPVTGMSVNVYDRPSDGSLRIDLQADPALYPREEIAAHHRRFTHLLRFLAESGPEQRLDDIDLLTDAERAQLLAAGRGRTRAVAAGWLHTRFEQQARRAPQATALVCRGVRLSRGEVNGRANQLARLLTEAAGAGPDRHIALALPRSADFMIALLAVLKSGAACVPLDTGSPTARNHTLLEDARPLVALATGETAAHVPDGIPVLRLDDPAVTGELAGRSAEDLEDRERVRAVSAQDAAYLAFTSGTTGRPKAVVVEHSQLANLFTDHLQELILPAARRIGHRLRAALTASFSFDTFWEGPLFLAAGQEVHVIDDQVRHDPAALVAHIVAERLDFLDLTPTLLRRLMTAGLFDAGLPHRPSTVMVGGEALDSDLWQQLRRQRATTFYNYYGPTESAVDAIYCRLDQRGERPVLGRPGYNVNAYVLDPAGKLLPAQATGELFLGGAQIARGYLNQPEQTARAFLPDPFGPPGARLYRTGDLVRWTSTGDLEYLGRVDDQLNLHGVRIERGEIEAALARHPAVSRCAVTVHHGAEGPQLAAHMLPAQRPGSGVWPSSGELRAFIAGRLPAAFVPASFSFHETLPVTAHGKLDYAALPAPTATARSGRGARTGPEKELCALFALVLGVDEVGIDDDFFDLGGHSLPAAKLITHIREQLGATVSLGALYQAPTVAALSELLTLDAPSTPAQEMLLPLRPTGDQPPLFCVHPAGGLGWCYAPLPRHLPAGLPVYALQAPDPRHDGVPVTTFDELIARYVHTLRTVQPSGPYRLLGWSLGGALAQALAARLTAEGEDVQLLAMLDSAPIQHTPPLPEHPDDGLIRQLLHEALGLPLAPLASPADPSSGGLSSTHEALPEGLSGVLHEEQIATAKALLAHYAALLPTHTPRPFDGDLLYFQASRNRPAHAPTSETWRPWITGRITHHSLDCTHHAIASPDHLKTVADLLAPHLSDTR
ncbi:amino acid adenylation domain-containing protein [Streptomyces sp. NPDC058308]|uniref:amino acid adenylation domain-containing protein n=1 Tax=Streptomyces sp. NPDC058308 TaxID=3346440 RepID=UPI0036E9714D